VQAWVEAGGGLMSMTGPHQQPDACRPPELVDRADGAELQRQRGLLLGSGHAVRAAPDQHGPDLAPFAGGLFIDIVDDGVGVNQTIMTLPPGPVGVVQERMMGRLFVFGDEWVEFDSQWMNMPDIKQFWVQTLSYLGPKDSCAVPQ
jgi:hypothetical protein